MICTKASFMLASKNSYSIALLQQMGLIENQIKPNPEVTLDSVNVSHLGN